MNREIGMPVIPRPGENLKQENSLARNKEAELMFPVASHEEMKTRAAVDAIHESLSNFPELAGRLVARCTRFVENEKQKIKEASRLCEEIFYEKKIDQKEAVETVLLRSIEVLEEIHEKIKKAGDRREKIIEEVTGELYKKQKTTAKAIEEIKKVAEQINHMLAEIDHVRIDIANKEEEMREEYMEERAREVREARENIDRKEFRDKWEKQGWVFEDDDDVEDLIWELYDESEYLFSRDDEFFESEEEKAAYEEEVKQHRERLKRYDSYRIQRDVENFKRIYDEDGSHYRFAVEYLDPQIAENTKRRSEEARIIFEPLVKKLEKLLHYQKNLEQKLERIIFGHESARLPKDFIKEIRSGLRNYQPEIPRTQKEIYLPVGVSSLLPKEHEMHLKPVDALGYLFWLNNQGQKVKFMVVDTIQETNYQALYSLSPEEARLKAKENGERDKKWYKAVIDLFHLNNIEMADFEELEQSQPFESAKNLMEEVEGKSPLIKNALNNRPVPK